LTSAVSVSAQWQIIVHRVRMQNMGTEKERWGTSLQNRNEDTPLDHWGFSKWQVPSEGLIPARRTEGDQFSSPWQDQYASLAT
jgi:hypothetical protein